MLRLTVSHDRGMVHEENHFEMISMPLWYGLTWFLCGGVDGHGLWPRASRIESSHWKVVHCACFQSCDVNHCVVSRYAHFSNSVRLGVIFPIYNLLCGIKKQTKKKEHILEEMDSGKGAFHCTIEIHISPWNSKSCCVTAGEEESISQTQTI